MEKINFSNNTKINTLLDNIINELSPFLEEQARSINELTAIGLALSAEQDIATILEMILSQARRFTHADGGTVYLLNKDGNELVFHVVENETLNIKMGGASGKTVTLPNVPLFTKDNKQNLSNVSAYVANTEEIVNIPDVYETIGFNFEGTKKFDSSINYKSKSMLVMPLRDHENKIIGVLQLINSTDQKTGESIAFSEDSIKMSSALASQAAVILTQHFLIKEMKELFESFIHAIATAIDEKSQYTGGHIQRVAELTMMIANKINQSEKGHFKDISLTPDQLDELRIAAWMHDTGKITTPDHIVDKSCKLETIFDRIELIKTRWIVIGLQTQLAAEKEKNNILKKTLDEINTEKIKTIEITCDQKINTLKNDLEFLTQINTGGEFMRDELLDRLKTIAKKTYSINGNEKNYITENEFYNLSIKKGTLTDEEREKINSHAHMSTQILNKLPWPKKLAGVPDIAGAHHEKLDGTGYPKGLIGDQINLQARIMAIADIFEALSARDRPYKESMPLSQINKILGFMVKDNHVDRNIVALLSKSGIDKKYAGKFLNKSQIDI